jgi:hypothetical protein
MIATSVWTCTVSSCESRTEPSRLRKVEGSHFIVTGVLHHAREHRFLAADEDIGREF